MTPRKDLLRFVNNCVFKGKNGDGVRVFALQHIDANERTQPVDEWEYGPGFDVDKCVTEVIERAESDARGIGGSQRYVLRAFFAESTIPGARQPFGIDGVDSEFDGGTGSSEPLGPRGREAFERRHVENMMKLTIGGSAETLRILRNENQALRDQNDKILKEYWELKTGTFKLMEDLVQQNHKRQMEIREFEQSEMLKQKAIEQVLPMVPTIANRMLGEKLLPESTTPESMTLKNLVDVLNREPALVQPLMQVFANHPAILASIWDLVQKYSPPQMGAPGGAPQT